MDSRITVILTVYDNDDIGKSQKIKVDCSLTVKGLKRLLARRYKAPLSAFYFDIDDNVPLRRAYGLNGCFYPPNSQPIDVYR